MKRGKKVAEIVAREIIKDAQRRQLPPGTRLPPESEMVERMNVGRGSLREALRILEVQGLLTIRPGPGGGPVIGDVSSRNFGSMSALFYMAKGATYRDVIEARLAINPLMARLVAERLPPDCEERLQARIALTKQVVDADDREWMLTASDFYAEIADMAGNGVLALFAASIQDIYLAHLPPTGYDRAHRDGVVKLHERIARAIVRGEGKAAERLMRERVTEFVESVARMHPNWLDEIVDWD